MELTNTEKLGRYVCLIYYNTTLPTAQQGGGLLAESLEYVLSDPRNRRGTTGRAWRQLMLGELTKISSSARFRVLGGRASREASIDGIDQEGAREKEVFLWKCVGEEIKRRLQ